MGTSESQLKFSNEEFSRSIVQEKSWWPFSLTDSLIILKHWAGTTRVKQYILHSVEWWVWMFLEPVSLWQQTESHLCFVAHLHLQRAAWVGMLIRCVHLRTNPFEYFDNIWQTSSTEWQAWPTAWELLLVQETQVFWCSSHGWLHSRPSN